MKREELKRMTDELRDKAALLGWSKTNAMALMRSARKYGGIENCLEAFRKAVKEEDGFGIKEDMAPVVRAYGTVKDKSQLLFLGCFDADVISVEEEKRLRDTVKKSFTVEERREHFDYFRKFYPLKEFMHIFQETAGAYYGAAYSLARSIGTYEAMRIIPKHFSRLMNLLPNGTEKEALAIMNGMSEELLEATNFGEFAVDEEHCCLYERDSEKLLSLIQEKAVRVNELLSDLKSVFTTLMEWAAEHEAEDFLPQTLFDARKELKESQGIVVISDRWLKRYAEVKRERGEEVSPEDDATAVLLTFDEAETTEKVKSYTKRKLDQLYDEKS